jgi:hypothetical protein
MIQQYPKIKFRRPYFVTPHAIRRFQERVLDLLRMTLPEMQIIQIINAALQVKRDPAWTYRMGQGRDRQLSRVYAALYAGIRYYIPTMHENGREWDIVPTILGPDMGQKKQEDSKDGDQT